MPITKLETIQERLRSTARQLRRYADLDRQGISLDGYDLQRIRDLERRRDALADLLDEAKQR